MFPTQNVNSLESLFFIDVNSLQQEAESFNSFGVFLGKKNNCVISCAPIQGPHPSKVAFENGVCHSSTTRLSHIKGAFK